MKERWKLKKIDTFLLLLLILMLALVRFFQESLFYDPFIDFFNSNYQNKVLPSYEPFKLYSNLIFRFSLNAIITILILFIVFKDKTVIKITSLLLIVFCVVLLFAFYLCTNYFSNYLVLFYIRRFLIQPLFLLILLPAFYFQKMSK